MRALDVPLLTPSPVSSKDGAPMYTPALKTIPPSPTRPIPPPPASPHPNPNRSVHLQPSGPPLHTVPMAAPERVHQKAVDAWERQVDPTAVRGKYRSDEMPNPPSLSSPSPSPSRSPPASVSGHAYGYAHIPRASLNARARSSPNLLMSMGICIGADSTAIATWGAGQGATRTSRRVVGSLNS